MATCFVPLASVLRKLDPGHPNTLHNSSGSSYTPFKALKKIKKLQASIGFDWQSEVFLTAEMQVLNKFPQELRLSRNRAAFSGTLRLTGLEVTDRELERQRSRKQPRIQGNRHPGLTSVRVCTLEELCQSCVGVPWRYCTDASTPAEEYPTWHVMGEITPLSARSQSCPINTRFTACKHSVFTELQASMQRHSCQLPFL